MRLLLGAGVLAVVTTPFAFAWFVSGFLVNAPERFPPALDPEAVRRADPRSTHDLALEDVRFRSEDGVDVAGWVVPRADRDPGRQLRSSTCTGSAARAGCRSD